MPLSSCSHGRGQCQTKCQKGQHMIIRLSSHDMPLKQHDICFICWVVGISTQLRKGSNMKSMSIGDKQFMHAFPCIYTVYIYIYLYIYNFFYYKYTYMHIFYRGREREKEGGLWHKEFYIRMFGILFLISQIFRFLQKNSVGDKGHITTQRLVIDFNTTSF